MPVSSEKVRTYRGSSAEARRAERREQIIAAGIQVYGELGYRNATVKAVCEAAGLTERYFYESFPNSEALLVAAFREVTGFLREVMEAAVATAPDEVMAQARALLTAYYSTLKAHPGAARVFLVEIGGVSPAIDAILHETLRALAYRLAPIPGAADPAAAGVSEDLLRMGVVGAILQITLSWIAAGYAHPLEEVVQTALRLSRTVLDPAAPHALGRD